MSKIAPALPSAQSVFQTADLSLKKIIESHAECLPKSRFDLCAEKVKRVIKGVIDFIVAFCFKFFCRIKLEKKAVIQKSPLPSTPSLKGIPAQISIDNTAEPKKITSLPIPSVKISEPIHLPKGVFGHVASFLDAKSHIRLSHVNRVYQERMEKQHKVLHITPERGDFFKKLRDPQFAEKYAKVEQIVLDKSYGVYDEKPHHRKTNGFTLNDESFIRSVVIAGKIKALPNLKRIFYNFRDSDNESIFQRGASEQRLVSLIRAFPKLQAIDVVSGRDHNDSIRAGIIAEQVFKKKAFDALAENCPDLRVVRFRTPHTVTNATAISPEELWEYLEKWPRLEVMHCPAYFTDVHLAVIAELCPHLQGISFATHSRLFTPQGMMEFFSRCQKIQRIDFLGKREWLSASLLQELGRHCPTLRELNLSGYPHEYCGRHIRALAGFPSLTSLSLSLCREAKDQDFDHLFSKLPDLEELSLDFSEEVPLTDAFLISLARRCPKLKKLHFKRMDSQVSQSGLIKLIKQLPLLESLHLPHHQAFDDELLEAIGESCPNLRCLNLSYSGKRMPDGIRYGYFTKNALKNLGQKCPKIQFLNIHCASFENHQEPGWPELQSYFPNLCSPSQFAYHALSTDRYSKHYGFLTHEDFDKH